MAITAVTATVDGITYALSGSADLLNFDQHFVEASPARDAGLPALSAGYNYRTFKVSLSDDILPVCFIRLDITASSP